MFLQNDDIEIIIPPEDEMINKAEKVDVNNVNLDETSSVIRNWTSLMNDDLDTIIPEYECVSTTKGKEQNESEVKLELEGIVDSQLLCF